MARNLVICCDGTNNEFGNENTNVVRIAQAIRIDPASQCLFYDPGVGTLSEPGYVTAFGKWLSKVRGLGFGAGLTRNIEEAYAFLMDNWEPGDRVYLFGFSRGAYTVRVLAGLLHQLGLLSKGQMGLLPYIMRLFKGIRSEKSRYWKVCDEFRLTFAQPVPNNSDRRFHIHFLGVWDTVSSVGWIWNPQSFPYTAKNPSISIVRHAVSIDERRAFFRQNLAHSADGQDFQELWFPGVHSDVGGGYPEADGGLWRAPFEWLLGEAQTAQLHVDQQRLQAVLNKTKASAKPWTDEQHESLTWKWWPAETFPKLRYSPKLGFQVPMLNLFRNRSIHDGALLHKSALLRIRDAKYAPSNLSQSFIDTVKALPNVPDTFPVA